MKTGHTFRLLLMMDITDFRFENGNADYVDEILIFSHILTKISILPFLPEESALLFLWKEVKPSPDHKRIKLLTFDTCFCY